MSRVKTTGAPQVMSHTLRVIYPYEAACKVAQMYVYYMSDLSVITALSVSETSTWERLVLLKPMSN